MSIDPACNSLQAFERLRCSLSRTYTTLKESTGHGTGTAGDHRGRTSSHLSGRWVGPAPPLLWQFDFKDDLGFPVTSYSHNKAWMPGVLTVLLVSDLYCPLGPLKASCLTVTLQMERDEPRTGNDMPMATQLINGRAHTKTWLFQASVERSFHWVSLAQSPLYNSDGEGSGPGDTEEKPSWVPSLTGTSEEWLAEKHAILAQEM